MATHLRVPTLAVMKYLSKELGAQIVGDTILQGNHSYDIMLKHLDKFIKNYVTCKKCNYPELKRFAEGKKDLKSKCNSCGTVNTHDAAGAAGKVLLANLDAKEDIQKKDDQNADFAEVIKAKPDKKAKKEQEYSDADDEINYQSRRIELSIKEIHKLSAEEHQEKEFMLECLTQQKIKYSLTSDWLHFIALCGIFPASTKAGIFKNWSKYEDLFIALVQEEGKIGV